MLSFFAFYNLQTATTSREKIHLRPAYSVPPRVGKYFKGLRVSVSQCQLLSVCGNMSNVSRYVPYYPRPLPLLAYSCISAFSFSYYGMNPKLSMTRIHLQSEHRRSAVLQSSLSQDYEAPAVNN